ncbi:Transcriptional regulator LytR [bioreactor metagenome]|uniref:Transcriptional regulator LytR n=1 Tax=bioreactor metagenome TaxID=1076179 RepID=A0A645HU61_9ZZZZ
MFSDIVNGIGGIDVNITESEAEYLRDTVKIPYIKAGKNHLNGGAALWFCRIRKLDDDFHRTERQRQVISSIVNTATKTNPFKLISTVKSVLPNIKTDIPPLKMTALIEGTGLIYMHYDIEQASVPFDGLWEDAMIDGQAVLSIDKNANINKLHQYIYESDK